LGNGHHLGASLAVTALAMALAARRPPWGTLVHHSDRGVQYACAEYTGLLETHGIAASMSRVGNPYDNAKAERFIRTLKSEEIDGTRYRDHGDAAGHIGAFIDQVDNRQRLHSALGYQTPVAFEAEHRAQTSATAPLAEVGFQGMRKSTVMPDAHDVNGDADEHRPSAPAASP
jgi:putative transposase